MKTKLAIFDFDGTLYTKESMPFIWKKYGDFGYSKIKQTIVMSKIMIIVLLAKTKLFKNITKETYKEKATQYMINLFKGFTKNEVNDFFLKVNKHIIKDLNHYVVKRLKDLKEEGYIVIVISAGYNDVIDKLKTILPIDYTIGTMIKYNDNGTVNIKSKLDLIKRNQKVTKLYELFNKENIDFDNSYCFSDSIVDVPILETVKNKEVINPDNELKALALKNGWIINGNIT